ncbi:hypothetical protein AOQ84DRAFT_261276, partial [Glonium stellatum]
ITSDVAFSCLPIIFLRKLRRPIREKLLLIFLMGLSFFATTASIVRAVDVKQYALSGDITWQTVNLAIWSSLEPYIGILAASLPCLKRPLEGALVH